MFYFCSIVDDLELYEEQKPFTLEQLVSMSSFLNKLCFNLIWHAGSAAKAVPATGELNFCHCLVRYEKSFFCLILP